VLAVLSILMGLALAAVYVWEAVILPWGEPDQSRLYWYAFLPLSGAILVRTGIRLLARTRPCA
jgi:hypothetical protein